MTPEEKPDSFKLCGSDKVWDATSDAQLTPGRDLLCPSGYMFSGWVKGFTTLIWTVS